MAAGSIFLMRMGLSILFAYMVVKIFRLGGGVVTVAGFAVFFVGLAYLLAHLRERRQGEERLQ
jgi:cytochrome b